MVNCSCHSHNGFLTAKGLAEAAQRSLEGLELREVGLTRGDECVRLDKSGSVSASELLQLHWDDAVINEQYRRFLNGS